MNRTETLNAALDAVSKRRAYGPPESNFDRIAARWRAHIKNRFGIDVAIDGVSVALMCADIKMARLEETPTHEDSWVDLAGYAACGAEVSGAPSAGGWVQMAGKWPAEPLRIGDELRTPDGRIGVISGKESDDYDGELPYRCATFEPEGFWPGPYEVEAYRRT